MVNPLFSEDDQAAWIQTRLSSLNLCTLEPRRPEVLSVVAKKVFGEILRGGFTSGAQMKALLCLFDSLFHVLESDRDGVIPTLTRNVNKWLKDIRNMTSGAHGAVLSAQFMDSKIIIKTPHSLDDSDETLREYLVGIECINNLRYTVPTFAYTLGGFRCSQLKKDKPICTSKKGITTFVVYESIPGETVYDALKSGKMDFKEWIRLFVQMLISLEIAQRDCSFTHYDLHTNNVMIRPVDNIRYSAVLDDLIYEIGPADTIPVIIDYGLSSVQLSGKNIGKYGFEKHGIYPYMIQGVDMYKFMVHSILSVGPESEIMISSIQSLFQIYGKSDPYNISKTGYEGAKGSYSEFCKKIVDSPRAASLTPLGMLKWVMDKYPSLTTQLKRRPRDMAFCIQYSSTVKEYENLLGNPAKGINYALEDANRCLQSTDSALMAGFGADTVRKYVVGMPIEEELEVKLRRLDSLYRSLDLIYSDKLFLETFKDIQKPDVEKCLDAIAMIIQTDRLGESYSLELFDWYYSLQPYLQFLYTARQLDVYDRYSRQLDSILGSDIYKTYLYMGPSIERASRWNKTLRASTT